MGEHVTRRKFLKLSGLAAGAAVAASAGPFVRTSRGQGAPLSIGYLKATHHSQFFNALDQGYYKDEGLEVKPVLFPGSGGIGEGILTGALQAGYIGSAPSIFICSRPNVPFNIVSGSATESSCVAVPFNRPTTIKQLTDLKGKNIGTIRAATADVVVRYKMLQAGVDPFKQATVRNFSHIQDILVGMEKGDLDAAILWEPWGTHAEYTKYGKPILWSGEIWPWHVCCRLAYNTKWADGNKEAAVKVMKTHVRGYQYMRANFEDNVKSSAKWCGITEKEVRIVFGQDRQKNTLNIDPYGSQEYAQAGVALGISESSDVQHNLNDVYLRAALAEISNKTA
jgi:ABC-type nitrate/sulfonate/bicarbonate transport system substrate-binding protein